MFNLVKRAARRAKYGFAKSVSEIPVAITHEIGDFSLQGYRPRIYSLPKLGIFGHETFDLTRLLFKPGPDGQVSIRDLSGLLRSSVIDYSEQLLTPSKAYKLHLLSPADNLPDLSVELPTSELAKRLFLPLQATESIDLLSLCEETCEVSPNLFEPLFLSTPKGKYYGDKLKKKEQKPEQTSIFEEFVPREKKPTYSKAYSRKKTDISTTVSYQDPWDLLFPILMPPLDFDFSSDMVFGELYPFQKVGVKFLVERSSALLADEMGTGKTVMSTVAMRSLFKNGSIQKALVVCPVSILGVWDDHLHDWAPDLSVTIVRGTLENRRMDWEHPAHVYVTTYDTVKNDVLPVLKGQKTFYCSNPDCHLELQFTKKRYVEMKDWTVKCPDCGEEIDEEDLPIRRPLLSKEHVESFDFVLLDEAQFIKNPAARRAKGVKRFSPAFRWGLSGTPIENKIDDLVSIFAFLKPRFLHRDVAYTPPQIRELVEPYFLRREKKDVLQDLPDKVKTEMWLDLDSHQRKEYDEAEQRGIHRMKQLGDKVSRPHIFAHINRLKQICNFAKGRDTSAKTVALLDLIKIIKSNDRKALVFSQYLPEGVDKLENLLREVGVVIYKGGMSDNQRRAAIERFKTDPDITVFLSTLKTGGLGLTLTEANYVIHFDHWWNPAVMWQAEDRVHRTGQKEVVDVYSFWMSDTIEKRIKSILFDKGLLFQEVVGGLAVEDIDQAISIDEWLEIIGVKPIRKATDEPPGGEAPDDIAQIYEKLRKMDPLHFEEVVKRLFIKLGYLNARLTKGSYDGGVDIQASRYSMGAVERVIVQCKRIDSCGAKYARELYGVSQSDPNISKAFLAVSGKCTDECRRFCLGKGNLVMLDGLSLAKYIKDRRVELG